MLLVELVIKAHHEWRESSCITITGGHLCGVFPPMVPTSVLLFCCFGYPNYTHSSEISFGRRPPALLIYPPPL